MYYYNLMRFLVLNRLQFLWDAENVYWSTRASIYIFASIQQTWLSSYNGNKVLKFVFKKVFRYGHGWLLMNSERKHWTIFENNENLRNEKYFWGKSFHLKFI